MAKRKPQPVTDPPPKPSLVVSREHADRWIAEQLEKGEAVRSQSIRSRDDLKAVNVSWSKWRKFVTEGLGRHFDSPAFAEEFDAAVGMVSFGGTTLEQDIDEFRDDMSTLIVRLESIRERLELVPERATETKSAPQTDKRKATPSTATADVFVVHGHDEAVRNSVARFLEKIGLKPIILYEQPNLSRTIIEKFEDYADAAYAVVLLTPDDLGRASGEKGEPRSRARQNVIFELGFFLGRLGRKRVCALYVPGTELPSDYDGVLWIELDGADGWRLKLAKEMKAAGLKFNLDGAL